MVDTSNEEIHPLFHSLTNSYSIYRVGSQSRTIKRYDGVATQGSSILILFVQYILPTNLNKYIYYWARTYSILIYSVGGSAHEYTDMCWCCIHFKFIIYRCKAEAQSKYNHSQGAANKYQLFVILREYCVNSWPIRQSKSFKSVNFA